MKWIAIITLGCFCAIASYSYAAYPAPKAVTFTEKRATAARKPKQAVNLWKRADTLADRQKVEASGLGVVDSVVENANQARLGCGEDFVCLLAWAEGRR